MLDLIRLSQNQIVLCDCHLRIEEAEKLTDPSRIVFLIKEPSNIVGDYCNRPDHQGFNDFSNSANDKHYKAIKDSAYFWIERTLESNVNETTEKVERHFGFVN